MNIDQLREFCLALPHATEDVKWGHDLCFSVGGKMFCITGLDPADGFSFSFKCTPERFAELTELEGIVPAPYVARYHWVLVENAVVLPDAELEKLVANSYGMVKAGLSKKVRDQLA